MASTHRNVETLRPPLSYFEVCRDVARRVYFQHTDPGGLTPAEKKAWTLEHFAFQLILEASQIRLDAEIEMRSLLEASRHG